MGRTCAVLLMSQCIQAQGHLVSFVSVLGRLSVCFWHVIVHSLVVHIINSLLQVSVD